MGGTVHGPGEVQAAHVAEMEPQSGFFSPQSKKSISKPNAQWAEKRK